MNELLREPDPARMGLLQSILETHGIATHILHDNEYNALALNLLGPPRLDPVLCVEREEDHAQALAVLRDHMKDEEVKSN